MKVLASNRRARLDYDITNELTAGVVLSGAEVKSIKNGHISLRGSFVNIQKGEPYLFNAHVSPYKFASQQSTEPTRSRKLLVHKKQLQDLFKQKQSGLMLVPLVVGVERGLVKIVVGVGRPRQRTDKRELVKKRQAKRTIERAIRKNRTS